MTVARKVVLGAIFNTLSGYGLQVITFVSSLILVRLLSTADVGAFALAQTISLIFSRIRLWGFEGLLLARTEPDDLEVSTQFWLSVGLGIITLVLISVATPLLGLIYESDLVRLTVYVTAISLFESYGAASTAEAMLVKSLRFATISSLNITGTLLGIMATIAGAWLRWHSYAMLFGYAVRLIFYFTACWILSPQRPKLMFSWERARQYFSEGQHLLWGGIGSFLAFQFDDLAVGTLAGVSVEGLYSRAYTLSQVPMSLVGGVMSVGAGAYAKVKADRAALSEAVRFMLDAVTLIVLPASVGLALIAPELIKIIYPPEWQGVTPMLQLLLLYSLVRPLNDAVGALATTTGRTRIYREYGIVQSVVMVITCTVLTLLWGANGAAISAGITVTVAFFVLVRRLLLATVDLDYRAIFVPPLVSAAIGAAVALGAMLIWKPQSGVLITLPNDIVLTLSTDFLIMLYKGMLFTLTFGASLLLIGGQALLMRIQRIYGALIGKAAPPMPAEVAPIP